MKPYSVSPTAYFNNYLGINITSSKANPPLRPEASSGKLKSEIQDRQSGYGLNAIDYLEKIYDVVVGFNHEEGKRFRPDPSLNERQRFGVQEIAQVIKHASAIITRYRPHQFEHQVFNKIILVATKYQDFLEGRIEKLPKDSDAGIRHTLVRGNKGRIYEMLNSMTDAELERCSEKTGGLIDAVENPAAPGTPVNGRQTYKVELGSGGFGRTRIAREIDREGRRSYVAVKKTHPKLMPSMTRGMIAREVAKSNFYKLPVEEQTALRRMRDAIITPSDECTVDSKKSARTNRTANAFNLSDCGSDSVTRALALDGIQRAMDDHLEEFDQLRFISKKLKDSFEPHENSEKSHYTFSELGITTLEALIEKFNVARFAFEGCVNVGRLLPQAERLQRHYDQKYSGAEAPNPTTEEIQSQIIDPNFELKDSVYNHQFLNTLAKKTLAALAELHKKGIAHQDVKPDNIVLTMDSHGVISAKLIDIDMLSPAGPVESEEIRGFEPFRPPESSILERDGSFSYTGIGGDSYAMGLTLRKMAGYGYDEIFQLSERLKLETTNERLKQQIKDSRIKNTHLNDRSEEMELALAKPLLPADNRLQRCIFLDAKDEVVPKAMSLKDIADRMLKDVDKRLTPAEALERPLFKDGHDTILPEPEFSQYARRVLRYGTVTRTKDVNNFNDKFKTDAGPVLPFVRLAARQAEAIHRGQTLSDDDSDGLSASEREHVDAREKNLQLKAVVRRTGRAINHGLRNGMANLGLAERLTIADQKSNYKK